jgi:lipoyl(octanoyl) transferase
VQHPHTFTVGRRIKTSSEEQHLRSLGADFHFSQRGGRITYHGPGQLVGYPILDLKMFDLKARQYVCGLEEMLIDTCKKFNVDSNASLKGNTGIWVGDNKIAALGIKIQRHVTSHGFALNCNTDLKWFDEIVPCGLFDMGVTSLSNEKLSDIGVEKVIPELVNSFEASFNAEVEDLLKLNPEYNRIIDNYLENNK